jgi:hypothetical protein
LLSTSAFEIENSIKCQQFFLSAVIEPAVCVVSLLGIPQLATPSYDRSAANMLFFLTDALQNPPQSGKSTG